MGVRVTLRPYRRVAFSSAPPGGHPQGASLLAFLFNAHEQKVGSS